MSNIWEAMARAQEQDKVPGYDLVNLEGRKKKDEDEKLPENLSPRQQDDCVGINVIAGR